MAIQSCDLFSIGTQVHLESEREIEERIDEEQAFLFLIESIVEIG